jgi:hypothetical protein
MTTFPGIDASNTTPGVVSKEAALPPGFAFVMDALPAPDCTPSVKYIVIVCAAETYEPLAGTTAKLVGMTVS